MPRAPNPEIGFIPCFCCGVRASLRKDAGGYLYYNCPTCGGPLNGHGKTWQDRCLEDATMHGEGGAPIIRNAKAPDVEEKPTPELEPKPTPAAKASEKKPDPEKTDYGFRL